MSVKTKTKKFVLALRDFVSDLERVYPYEEVDTKGMTFKEQMELGLSSQGKNTSQTGECYDIYRYGKHIKKEKRHPKTLLRDFKSYSYDNYVERYEQVLVQIQKKKQLRKIYLLPGINFGHLPLHDDTRIAICAHLKKLYTMVSDIWSKSYDEFLTELSDSDSDVETSDEEGELELDTEFLTEGAKSLLMGKTDNPDLANLIGDTVGSVTETINNDEELKGALNSMKGVGDIFKLLSNDKFSNMMEGLAKNLGTKYADKVQRGEASSENLMKAGQQISENIDKNMPEGVKDMINSQIASETTSGTASEISREETVKKTKTEAQKERIRRKRQKRKENRKKKNKTG